jgi:ribonuclease T2
MPTARAFAFTLLGRRRAAVAAGLGILGILSSLGSQAPAQGPPYRERPETYPRSTGPAPGAEHRAGQFDYYVLALSWSPTYCADRSDRRYNPQCDVATDRPYAFVLHGLWPQYERGWPERCRSPDRGYVPRPVANRMRDIMPSDKLIFNEYRKHGTCSGLGVDGYFALARTLYDKVRIPPRFINLNEERLLVSPQQLVRQFVEANPGLKPDMVAVQCGGTGPRLKDVRICFDKAGAFRSCGSNETGRRLCAARVIYVPPVRAGRNGAAPHAPGLEREILPGPREDRRL